MNERWFALRVVIEMLAVGGAGLRFISTSPIPSALPGRFLVFGAVVTASFAVGWFWTHLLVPSVDRPSRSSRSIPGVLVLIGVGLALTLSATQGVLVGAGLVLVLFPAFIAIEIKNAQSGGAIFRASLNQ